MMLGPFWCVEENAWLRFDVNEKGEAFAQMARMNKHHPTLTNPWQQVDLTHWHVFDETMEEGDPDAHSYFVLRDQAIFRFNGTSKLTQQPMVTRLTIGQDNQANWTVATKTRLFENFATLPKTCPNISLPMTPEDFLVVWDQIKGHLDLSEIANTVHSEFNQAQREELIGSLEPYVSFQTQSTPLSYLDTLQKILNNEATSTREELKQQAARTVDYDTLIGSTINDLPKKKETFFLNVIRALYNHICALLHIKPLPSKDTLVTMEPNVTREVPALKTSPLPPHTRAKAIRLDYINHQETSLFSLDQQQELIASLEKILDRSELQHQITEVNYQQMSHNIVEDIEHPVHQAILALTYDEDTRADRMLNPSRNDELQEIIRYNKLKFFLGVLKTNGEHTIEPGSEKDSSIASTPSTIKGSEKAANKTSSKLNQQIIVALQQAQHKYAEWYKQEQQHRGPNGFFSWARHSSYGQTRALTLTNKIEDCTDTQTMMDSINQFLIDSETRYYRHSFASFLLDELTQIESTHWALLRADASNHYDKSEVNDTCSAIFKI